MPIRNLNNIAVCDFETTGNNPNECEPIEIACQIYNERSLELIPGAEFDMMCRPNVEIDPKVYDITGIKPEDVQKAPPIKLVYPKFVEFLLQYNVEKTKWSALLFCGQNSIYFDRPIHERMLTKYCKGIESEKVFRQRSLDLMDMTHLWFHNEKDPSGYGLDAMRQYFGLSGEGHHRALKDVADTAAIMTKLLSFGREISRIYCPKMKDFFKKKNGKKYKVEVV